MTCELKERASTCPLGMSLLDERSLEITWEIMLTLKSHRVWFFSPFWNALKRPHLLLDKPTNLIEDQKWVHIYEIKYIGPLLQDDRKECLCFKCSINQFYFFVNKKKIESKGLTKSIKTIKDFWKGFI